MKFFSTLILSLVSVSGFGQAWETVGLQPPFVTETFIPIGYSPLAISKSGTPYVAYSNVLSDGSPYNSFKATALEFDGNSWQPVGPITGFSESQAGGISITLDANNIPYVVYQDAAYSNGKATVMKYQNNSWTTVGSPGFSTDVATYSVIALDNAGAIYVAYTEFSTKRATVMKYDGNNWATVGNAGFSAGITGFISMAIDNVGMPYVVYQDGANGNKATVMKYNGSSWVSVGTPGFSPDSVQYTSIIIDKSGTPYTAFADGADSLKATVMKYDGNNWVVVGNEGISDGRALGMKIIIDTNNIPYVVYQDYGNASKAIVKKYINNSWEGVGDAASPGQGIISVAYYPSISISRDNNVPYILYFQHLSNNGKYGSVIRRYDNTPNGIKNTGGVDTNKLTVFPNPNNGDFTIEGDLQRNNKKAEIEIIDVSGKTIWNGNIKTKDGKINSQINLRNHLIPGIYFIKVCADSFSRTVQFVIN